MSGLTTDHRAPTPTPLPQAADWVRQQLPETTPQQWWQGRETAAILASLNVAEQDIQAGFLQAFLPLPAPAKDAFIDAFGAPTWQLLQGVEQIQQLSALSRHTERADGHRAAAVSEENLRKMLITMVDDVRVILIKLADQLGQLRAAKDQDENRQYQLARLTQDIYAPLANRLGIWQLKWEMEDFGLRYLQPTAYRQLARQLQETRRARERYIAALLAQLKTAMTTADIECQLSGRPKHLYSIWKKMRQKGRTFDNLWDIRAVRILVDTVADCYATLGIVHTNWRHLPGEFDDYIATPKENGYRSIHTVVIGPEGKSVEVQIRTHQMHTENEFSVAAHWRYKENTGPDQNIDDKVLWLRQLLEWHDEVIDDDQLLQRLHSDSEHRQIYVFTPQGKVLDFPQGATPIDFAYAIHSEVGNRIRGARVNGKMVGLDYRLETGDQVQIQTSKDGKPSRDWIRSDLRYVKTHRARSRIQHWFKQEDYDQHVAAGRSMLERELSRLGLAGLSYDKIAEKTHFRKTEDLLAALGANDYKLSKALYPFKRQIEPPPPSIAPSPARLQPPQARVQGVGNLVNHIAKCCRPVPEDRIVGFITAGRGVTIHRQSCHNIVNLQADRINRLIEVEWGEYEQSSYPIDIALTAYARSELLHDITQTLKNHKLHVHKLNMQTDDEHIATIHLRLEISGLQKLSRVLHQLQQIRNVLSANRVSG